MTSGPIWTGDGAPGQGRDRVVVTVTEEGRVRGLTRGDIVAPVRGRESDTTVEAAKDHQEAGEGQGHVTGMMKSLKVGN